MIGELISRLILGPLELLFDVVYAVSWRITGNRGFSIVLLSLAVNLLLLPLYRRADAVQEKEREQAKKMAPMAARIKRAFKGDERFMILQTYYRQNNYKPYHVLKESVSLLLEIPFFIAAYRYLSGLSLLQGAAFGPIRDLGQPDQMLNVFGTGVNVLPILMTIINIASGTVYSRGLPMKSRVQLFGMALVFLVLLYNSPSGLVLYWTLNNTFSLVKNIVLKYAGGKRTAEKDDTEAGKDAIADGKTDTLFHVCCLMMTILLGVLIPSAIVNASPGEFVEISDFKSPLWYVLYSAIMACGTFMVWGTVFYRLASGKGRIRLAEGLAAVSAAAVVSYMFFGKGYGNLSPLLKYDEPPVLVPSECLLNLGAVLAAVGAVILVWRKKPEILKAVCIAGCIGLAVMSAMNINGISAESAELEAVAEQEKLKPKPSFTLSREGKNVVVIMLDRCINGFVPYIFEENPEVAEQFSGFTYYPNTLSFGRNTNVCTPSLYGGYEYRPFELDKRSDMGLPDKQNEALKVMPVLFMENGFQVTVCDPPYAGYLWIPDLSIYDDYPEIRRFNTNGAFMDNTEAIRKKDRTIYRNLFCYSVFRAVPVLLQAEVYNEGKYNDAEALAANPWDEYGAVFSAESELRSTGISDEFMKAYTALQNLCGMTEIEGEKGSAGLADNTDNTIITDKYNNSAGAKNTFLILSNTATHDVTLLQEPEYEPRSVVDNTEYEAEHGTRTLASGRRLELKTLEQMEHYQCDTAAMIQLGKWFDYLRENGVWDNTRIILVSDHGYELELNHILTGGEEGENALSPYDGVMAYNALMMIKDFGSGDDYGSGDDQLKTDMTFMTIADTPTEAMRGLIENPVNPFTGNSLSAETAADAKNEEEQYVMLTDWRIAVNNGKQYSDPVRLTLSNQYLFDERNWEVP